MGSRTPTTASCRALASLTCASASQRAFAAGAAVSIDPSSPARDRFADAAGDAQHVGGHYARQLALPTHLTWSDIPDLRKRRALRAFREVMRELEAEAMSATGPPAELDDRIQLEYARRTEQAASRGLPFAGRASDGT